MDIVQTLEVQSCYVYFFLLSEQFPVNFHITDFGESWVTLVPKFFGLPTSNVETSEAWITNKEKPLISWGIHLCAGGFLLHSDWVSVSVLDRMCFLIRDFELMKKHFSTRLQETEAKQNHICFTALLKNREA